MTLYRCNVCNHFEYEPDRGNSLTNIHPGTQPSQFPSGWVCPICGSDPTHLTPVTDYPVPDDHERSGAEYLAEWERPSDDLEEYMADIHTMAVTGESIIEPMRTRKPVISWDDILIKGAQIARIPLNEDIAVTTRTVIGPKAQYPLVIETPVYVTHMSFGALSKEVKIAIAKGTAAVKTAMGSGEGGMLPESRQFAYKYILEYVPNRYSITEENLKSADAIEIKIGQSAEPGMGARLPAEKVTAEIAKIRGYPEGTDIISSARPPEENQSGSRLLQATLKRILQQWYMPDQTSSPSTAGRVRLALHCSISRPQPRSRPYSPCTGHGDISIQTISKIYRLS
jgi:rubredoxin